MRHLAVTALVAVALAAPAVPSSAAPTLPPVPVVGCPQTSGGVPVLNWSKDLGTGEDNATPWAYGTDDWPDWYSVGTASGRAYSVAPNSAWITSPNANWINSATTNASGGSGGVVVDIGHDVPDVSSTLGDVAGTAGNVVGQVAGDAARDVVVSAGDLAGNLAATVGSKVGTGRLGGPITVVPAHTTFRIDFQLPDLSFNRSLRLDYAADNGVTFYLNGVAIGGYEPGNVGGVAAVAAFNQFHSLAVNETGFVDGVNHLDAVVTDYGVSTGLLVLGTARACWPGIDYLPGTKCIYVTRDHAGLYTTPAQRYDVGTVSNAGWSTTAPVSGPAYAVTNPPTAWVAGQWINNTGNAYTSGSATYQTTFPMALNATNQGLDLQVAADNAVDLYLNGTLIQSIPANAYSAKHHVVWYGPFNGGTNTLTAVVTDDGIAAAGLLVEGAAVSCPADPPVS